MKLIDVLSGLDFQGEIEEDIEIQGIAYDSRKVSKGFIFVAIKGFKVDGHQYIEQALKKGAVAVIVQESLPTEYKQIKVDDARKALSIISKNFYKNPTDKINVIGVTGTNGKTSITYIIRNILEGMNLESGLIGTIQNLIGDKIVDSKSTTPESLELNELFTEMIFNKIQYAVMEVSSHALSLSRVNDINFDVGVFTNLTQDHLDYHKNMESYFNEKRKLFKISKKCLINYDDAYGKKLYNEFKDKSYTYSLIDLKADFYGKLLNTSREGTLFELTYKENKYEIKTPFFGDIYILNTLAAIASLVMIGFDIQEILNAIHSIKPVSGRLEVVANKIGINIFVDYAHTPDALKNVLNIGKSFTKGKLISVFGCGGNRDKDKRPKMGKISDEIADFTIITSDNPRNEDPKMILEDIVKGIPSNSQKYEVVLDRKTAIEKSIEIASPGDTIIIAGKGHETYQIIGEEVIHFSDSEVALAYLKGKK